MGAQELHISRQDSLAHQAEFERRWLARQDAPMWALHQLVLCKHALNPMKNSSDQIRPIHSSLAYCHAWWSDGGQMQ